MKAFESASGENLDEDKKELASEELITTGDLGEDIGQDKATGIINDIKTEVIKNGTSDVTQIADTINNVTNNYNVTLTDAQVKQITDLMEKIAAQNYNYNEMKDTLNGIKDTLNDKLEEQGVKIDKGFFDSIKDWFSGLFGNNKDLGILNTTDDSILGSDAKIDATDDSAINLPSNEEVEGFFEKVWNWFTGLFNSSNDDSTNENQINDTTNSSNTDSDNNSSLDDSVNKLEENSTTDENIQSGSSEQDNSNNSQNTSDSEHNTNQ